MSFKNRLNKKMIYLFVLFFGLAIVVNSCYTDYGLTTSDYDVVLTRYDKEADFGSFRTYALPDTVFHIVGDEEDEISRQFDALMLQKVASNMASRGFTRIDNPDSSNIPDAVVTISVTTTDYTGVSYYPPYWGYPGWGWYYPPYYPPYWGTTYSYSTGTIFIDFGDVDNVADSSLVTVEWNATINGLLSSNASSTRARIEDSINQAFTQSPYLKTN
ncbi:MAG: DUF4136 domain-containing protein [Chlorobi bacterium]|nr:DUF4136 domain-containing protein [Chlorobiota bacterium]